MVRIRERRERRNDLDRMCRMDRMRKMISWALGSLRREEDLPHPVHPAHPLLQFPQFRAWLATIDRLLDPTKSDLPPDPVEEIGDAHDQRSIGSFRSPLEAAGLDERCGPLGHPALDDPCVEIDDQYSGVPTSR
jgi:hypothetical protein